MHDELKYLIEKDYNELTCRSYVHTERERECASALRHRYLIHVFFLILACGDTQLQAFIKGDLTMKVPTNGLSCRTDDGKQLCVAECIPAYFAIGEVGAKCGEKDPEIVGTCARTYRNLFSELYTH